MTDHIASADQYRRRLYQIASRELHYTLWMEHPSIMLTLKAKPPHKSQDRLKRRQSIQEWQKPGTRATL